MARADAIAVLGTGSSVGKSLVAAGLGRALARRGVRVAPFKAQNMSNNAAVTADGGEIGRAQAMQAVACGVEPHVDMNPILLKPEADGRSQVVLAGRAVGAESARAYFATVDRRFSAVAAAYDRLAAAYDAIVIEGAGSCAELNLVDRDLVNWRMAAHAGARVVIVADIERGGVFAQLIGTHALVDDAHRAMIAGFIVNKFRGDRSLFDDGVAILEQRTGIPVLGVVPRLMDLQVDDEDGAGELDPRRVRFSDDTVNIAVIALPRVSNMSDVTALAAERDVALRWAHRPEHLAGADAIILPGSKSTLSDLAHLRSTGLADAIAGSGAQVVGVCGGLQMLGRSIDDPDGVEGGGRARGLGLLDLDTVLAPHKVTARRRAVAHVVGDVEVTGYEIHCGRSTPARTPALTIDGQPDGAIRDDRRAWGTYLHGVFDGAAFRRAWLNELRATKRLPALPPSVSAAVDELLGRELDRWTDHLEASLRPGAIDRLLLR